MNKGCGAKQEVRCQFSGLMVQTYTLTGTQPGFKKAHIFGNPSKLSGTGTVAHSKGRASNENAGRLGIFTERVRQSRQL
jgi:hypothetical protein